MSFYTKRGTYVTESQKLEYLLPTSVKSGEFFDIMKKKKKLLDNEFFQNYQFFSLKKLQIFIGFYQI